MAPLILKFHSPRLRKKIAAFDFDWTLVKPLNGRTFPKDVADQQWLRPSVPEVLKKTYDDGYAIIVFTNQSKVWKIDAIQAQLEPLGFPITVAIGIAEDDRKPNTTMWDAAVTNKWDTKKSFYVGDAAGRPGDWSNTDALFAKAVGVAFKTPEDAFPFTSHVIEKASPTLTASQHENAEAIVMIGYPGSGKTTIAKSSFSGYEYIDGDKLKTGPRMVAAAEKGRTITKCTSFVFDATNASKERRAFYIDWAKSHGIPIRAIWVDVSIDSAMEAAKKRETETGDSIPRIAFYTFRKRFEEPTIDEGFYSVQRISSQHA